MAQVAAVSRQPSVNRLTLRGNLKNGTGCGGGRETRAEPVSRSAATCEMAKVAAERPIRPPSPPAGCPRQPAKWQGLRREDAMNSHRQVPLCGNLKNGTGCGGQSSTERQPVDAPRQPEKWHRLRRWPRNAGRTSFAFRGNLRNGQGCGGTAHPPAKSPGRLPAATCKMAQVAAAFLARASRRRGVAGVVAEGGGRPPVQLPHGLVADQHLDHD